MLKKFLNNLASLILTLILSLSIVYASTSSMCLNYPLHFIAIIIAACLCLYFIIFLNRKTFFIFTLLIGLSLVGSVIYIIHKAMFSNIYTFLDGYFYWLFDFIEYGGIAGKLFINITVISLCILISAYSFAFIYKKFIFMLILLPGVAYFVIQWAYDFVTSLMPFYIFLFSILMCYLKHIHKKKITGAPNEYVGNASFLVWALPVCLVVVLSANLVKTNDKPIEWKWLDKKVNSVFSYFSNKFDNVEFDYFSVASSGFGGKNSILGGKVKLNKTLVLTVETDKRIYLKGTSYDFYTGSKWLNKSGELESIGKNDKSLYFDTQEMLAGMFLLTSNNNFIDDYFYKSNVKVVYQNIKTKSIFLPVMISSFTSDKKDLKSLLDSNGSLVSTNRLGKGFKYSFDVLVPKQGNQEFIQALRNSQTFRTRRLGKLFSSSTNNANKIYINYLQTPETLPQRVYDLATSLTSMCNNDYDKVKALENYLSSEFPYNIDVRSTPRGRDFVDYFLFDQKEGYCTYFASALTILARCIGIPARYVEGYGLPPKPSENNKNLFYVTNQQAHAWTEVYFEGYGWLPFEPTSPFRASFYTNPEESAVYSSSFENNPDYKNYMEMLGKYGNENLNTPVENSDINVEKVPYKFNTIIISGIIVLIICMVLLISNLRVKIRIYKLMNLPPRESVLGLYKLFISVLAIQGLPIQNSETPTQYAVRIDRHMYFNHIKFSAITDIFIKTRYSTNETSEKEKQIISDFVRSIMSETVNNMGKFKFFFYRNILGKV